MVTAKRKSPQEQFEATLSRLTQEVADVNKQLQTALVDVGELRLKLKSRGEEVGAWMDKCAKEARNSAELHRQIDDLQGALHTARTMREESEQRIVEAAAMLKLIRFVSFGPSGGSVENPEARALIAVHQLLLGSTDVR